jgi:hypothetical protein
MVINVKYKGLISSTINTIVMIYSLHDPTVSGMPALVTIYKHRKCKVVIESFALYNVGVIELELQALLSINGDNISKIISQTQEKIPELQKRHFKVEILD